MPATITALLRRADLGLTLLAGTDAPQLATPIRWVTTSELLDPTPYLRGGELLLTTGMRLKSAKPDMRQYVSRLAAAGAVGIGIGVGSDLAFRRPPQRLAAAAADVGLPLLLVDEPTPFIAIGEAVAELHLADETAALADALRGQQAITRAAVTGGPTEVVRTLAALLGGWVVVTDVDGDLRYDSPAGVGKQAGSWKAELDRLTSGHASAAVVTADTHVSFQPVADAHGSAPLGYLICGRATTPTTAHHSMTNVAAALLTLAGGESGRVRAPVAVPGEPERDEAIRIALAGYSRRSSVRLAESLRVWLAHHGRIEPAAAELGIHRNTLRYRIMKAERLLGRDLDDPAARADLWAALRG